MFANIKTIHSDVNTCSFAYCSVIVENIYTWQIVFFPKHVVIYIMSWRNLKTTCTKFNIHIVVFDNRNFTSNERNYYSFTLKPLIFRIIWVDTHRGISHNSFWTSSGYNCVFLFFANNLVAEIVKFSLLFFVNNLLIRKSRESFGVPIDHAHSTINQTFVIKVAKHFNNRFGTYIVHSECRTIPIARRTKFTKLFENDSAMLIGPLPSMFQKFLARKVSFFYSFLRQTIYHFCFSSNRSVVSSRNPTSIFPSHTSTTNKNILNRIV